MADTLYELSNSPHGGKTMRSVYELENSRVVVLDTRKRSSGRITTTASVQHVQGGSLIHKLYRDFHKTCAQSVPGARATAKAVEEQHRSVLVEDLKAEIAAYEKLASAKD